MVGKGQPPKKPEDKRKRLEIGLSEIERAKIENARDMESPGTKTGTFIRNAALEKAEKILKKQ